jgi:hypothetical protein
MISLAIWLCLWLSFFVFAPPPPSSLNIDQRRSLENLTHITSHLLNTNSAMLIKRRKTKLNRTSTAINHHNFDINSYRSSWKFVDKNTVRIRFRLYESLLSSIKSTHFLVRHTHTGNIRTYNEPHEIMNSTLTLYLHHLKHGRHTVCLLLYASKLITNPKHIFCQDIIFNFHKYGHHDIDSEEYKNTFFFLLTQYAIVCGLLLILQLVHAARKRRFLGTVYAKANALRHTMMDYHHRGHDHKSTPDLTNRTHALEYLIYNLNRKALYDFDQMYIPTINEDDVNLIIDSPISTHQRTIYKKYLKLPNRTTRTTTNDSYELGEDNHFDTRSFEDQSLSYKSVSHILEANKPWITRLTDNGSVVQSLLSSESLQNNRVHHL